MTALELVKDLKPALSDRQRDYLLVTVYVLAQNGNHIRAKQIVDGMVVLGERSERLLQCQAVLAFFAGDYAETLACLDQLDLLDRHDASADVIRMRRYLRAKCYFASGRETEAQDIASGLAAGPKKEFAQRPK